MQVELTGEDIQTLIESLRYSKQRVEDAQGTPPTVRKENLARIESAAIKLRNVGTSSK
ncbi:MAG: hypothetical protein AABP62_08280 [Planctomycetota bacterium]